MPVAIYVDARTGKLLATAPYEDCARAHNPPSLMPVPDRRFRCCHCRHIFEAVPPTECPSCRNLYVEVKDV